MNGAPGRRGEAGQAMLIVMVAVALLATIPLAIATTVAGQLPLSTSHLVWTDAYEAAQAGLNDYLQHLDANEGYTAYSASNEPTPSNPAFTGWEAVGGTANPVECFEYTPTVLQGNQGGLVQLTVSGKATEADGSTACATKSSNPSTAVRNFVYTLRPGSSLDTVYWSNYETMPGGSCDTYQGENGYNGYSSGCAVSFATGDVLDGPVFSNDGFYICGSPVFENTVTSADAFMDSAANPAASNRWSQDSGSGCSGGPQFEAPAPDNTVLHGTVQEPQSTVTADQTPAQNYGCYINGNTTIVLNGTTLIWNGGTLANNASNPNSAAACGASNATVTFANLKSALIYVNGTLSVIGKVQGDLDLVATGDIDILGPVTYPQSDITNYGVSNADWTDPTDSLGLVSGGDINISHDGNGKQCAAYTGTNPKTTAPPTLDSCDYIQGNAANVCGTSADPCGIEVDAAMLALTGSFEVDNYGSGHQEGTLRVFGSIAQYNRGIVELIGTSGYEKDYRYDEALHVLWPPYFLEPNGAYWLPTSYAELHSGMRYEAISGS